MSKLVAVGSTLAAAGALHAAVNSRLLHRPVDSAAERDVAILVPARDEAAHIDACVRSLREQGDVLVLDDDSSDGTAAIARAAGARVLAGSPPPPGWRGKPWACAQLAAATDGDELVFVDADVRLAPGAVAAAVELLDVADLDIVCPFPRQHTWSAGERLVQPLLQWSWLTLLPLRVAERSPRPSLTAACGQFVVVRRAALERAGGFAAVRTAVLDDIALVRAIKASGGRGGVVDGAALAECRMYEGWAQLRDGYRKSLWAAFGSPWRAAGVLALLGLAYVLPPLAALRGSRAGALGYFAAVASRVIAARRTGGRALPDALAHPVSIAVFGYLTGTSLREHRRGDLAWKGRSI
ncbi:MAG TPA: glycosyltransferase family 2 protein [Jatrophihabitans sp.]|nr:glycosyltransferase family 2 protein [Jatrophihabitans sp.]